MIKTLNIWLYKNVILFKKQMHAIVTDEKIALLKEWGAQISPILCVYLYYYH